MNRIVRTLKSSDTPAQRADAIMALLAYDGDPQDIAAIRGTIAETLRCYAEIDAEARR